jgi:hypothetical protein
LGSALDIDNDIRIHQSARLWEANPPRRDDEGTATSTLSRAGNDGSQWNTLVHRGMIAPCELDRALQARPILALGPVARAARDRLASLFSA